jgi:hypothetical protein
MTALLAIAAAVLVAAAAATAQMEAPADSAKLVPNVAGKGSKLVIDVRPPAGQATPTSAVLSIARGFRFNRRSRRTRCTDDQNSSFSCPASSRVARGTADITASGLLIGGTRHYVANIEAFLARRFQPGDIAGFFVQASEPTTGIRGSSEVRLVRKGSGPYGSELRFEGFPATSSLPPGITVHIDRIRAKIGASRRIRVRKRVNGRVRHRRKRVYLIRNPRRCRGSWPYKLHLTFSDHNEDYIGKAACRKRR